MKKVFFFVLIFSLIALTMPSLAVPVPVPCGEYPAQVEYGHSYCITACAGVATSFPLLAQFPGEDAVPIFVFTPGCSSCETSRNLCVPMASVPTTYDRVQSTPPGHWDYIWSSDCVFITAWHVHDNYWTIDLFSMCDGCFCLTFDHQESVELSSFTAESDANAITLNWSTASETQSSLWQVRRSESENGEFATVHQMPAAGTTAQVHNYSWTDDQVVAGRTYYYQLSEQDINGRVTVLNKIVQAALTTGNGSLPNDYALEQNYPNPFNPTTQISFNMKEAGFVTLKVYNMIGQEVAVLVNDNVTAGRHSVQFNAANLPSALYLCKMETVGYSAVNKMLLMK
jgi:hypothetical protein